MAFLQHQLPADFPPRGIRVIAYLSARQICLYIHWFQGCSLPVVQPESIVSQVFWHKIAYVNRFQGH